MARSQSNKPKPSKLLKKDKKTPEQEKQEDRAEESDNSIDWGDVSIEEEVLGDLIDYVREAYNEVRAEENKIIETDGLARYLWVHQQQPKKYRVSLRFRQF
ncbi:hypothetical protein Tcan_05358 [Toxocara canis]|uniref:Uncharacterized protein n=1 Tax=Toxocara canis TaxID=6265 RepID=A0A0B2W1P0_TOXCA|nr:hypothetical protein Tcan_05358 [Toxocara canis]